MNLEEAKSQLEKEWDERHAKWKEEALVRFEEGTADDLDRLVYLRDKDVPNHWYGWFKDRWWAMKRWVSENLIRRYWLASLRNRRERARQGWGHQDVWNLADHLAKTLPGALRHLAKTTHGYPLEIFDENGKGMIFGECELENGTPPQELQRQQVVSSVGFLNLDLEEEPDKSDEYMDLWRATIERMAVGFEAFEVLSEHGWRGDSEAEKELDRLYREGFMLFYYNFGALWD